MMHHRLILTSFVGLVALTSAAAQEAPEAPVVTVPFEGTEAFGHILHSFGLRPVSKIEDAGQLNPAKLLLVVFGDLQALEKLKPALGTLESFRSKGGAILLASDYRANLAALAPGLTIAGQKVFAHEESSYKREWHECPVVFGPDVHPLFKGLRMGLATNRPSFLHATQPDLPILAGFAGDCNLLSPRVWQLPLPNGAGYICASPRGTSPGGRTLVLAGQGVFLNGMLIQTDNDNFAFAWNALTWLAEGPGGRRDHALFIEDGALIDKFALPLSGFGPVPLPPLAVINRTIRGLEDENIFNRMLIESVGKAPILRGLLLVASIALVLMAAWRIRHGRFRLDVGVPLLVSKPAAGPPAPPALPVLWQRQEELRRQGNLWEPAQVLVRQFFLDHASLQVPLWDDDAGSPPPLTAHGSFWQRRALTRQIQELWNLARSSPAQGVSPRQFDALLQSLAEAAAAVNEGRLEFRAA